MSLKSLKVDGGASANDFILQFQADLLNAEINRPKVIETTALGAAYLAGLAVSYYKDVEEIKENLLIDKVFTPQIDDEQRENLYSGWKDCVSRIRSV